MLETNIKEDKFNIFSNITYAMFIQSCVLDSGSHVLVMHVLDSGKVIKKTNGEI